MSSGGIDARAAGVIAYEINDAWEDHPWGRAAWFEAGLRPWVLLAPSGRAIYYDYIQIVPAADWGEFYCDNSGAQAFRYRETGWTFPDHCRYTGGYPEIWHKADAGGRRRLNDVERDRIKAVGHILVGLWKTRREELAAPAPWTRRRRRR